MADAGVAGRIKAALISTGLTQSELAAKLDVSQPAVNQWVNGTKQPKLSTIRQLAELLKCSEQWLLAGTGQGPEPDLEAGRADYSVNWGVRFRRAPKDEGRDYGNANVWAFDPNIWTMVRDIIQNSRDARPDGATEPVQVTFRIITLRGPDLDAFLSALGWNQLKSHLGASAQVDQRLGRLIKHSLARLERTKELRLLVVEDFGTIGLLGPEFGEGNFAALCRNNLDSNKRSGTAGGAFGLGKAVLWRVSEFSLVLFNSNLKVPTEGRQECRVFGRCDLPWHFSKGRDWAGPGWFGRVEPAGEGDERTVSYWGNLALAKDLYLDRSSLGSGTSIAVVGFHDPSDDTEGGPDALAAQIEKAVADWFWPDISLGRLRVAVEIYDGPKRRSGTDISPTKYQPEFVDAFEKFQRGELVDELTAEGDIALRRIALAIPARREKPQHPKETHQAVLLVRRAADDSKSDKLNHIAMFRGVGMVVRYESLKGICIGAAPCHAVLLCGEAAGDTPECRMADRFLRTAEPPAHERWTSTPDLKTEYAPGGLSAITELLATAKDAIRELVRPSTRELSDGPNALKELLRIGDPPKTEDRPKVSRASGTVETDGSWLIEARIRVKRTEDAWDVEPTVLFEQETGGGQRVSWKELEPAHNCSLISPGVLRISPNVTEARFVGRTDPSSHLIDAREAAITVDLKRFDRNKGGSQ